MQEAMNRSVEAGYMDFECESIKGTDQFIMDPLFWYFLGIAEGWAPNIWRLQRKLYFEGISKNFSPDQCFKEMLKK